MNRLFSKDSAGWLLLLAVSLPVALLLHRQGLPAAFLVGPMLCGIAFSVAGAGLELPRHYFVGAQALIGCAVAESVTAAIVVTIVRDWAIMCLVVASTVLAGLIVGWTLVKFRTLPGTTAAWGSTPGGASAMVAMAEAYGADARLVALMQYLRVLIVVLTASMVAQFLLTAAPDIVARPPRSLAFGAWLPILVTLGLAATGILLTRYLRIPAGAILLPIVIGGALHATGCLSMHQPFWMQAVAAATLGWYVGLGFNRRLLLSALRLLPRLVLSAVFLIALCGFSAALLVHFLHTDPLTAYLATSPGGLDSMILIAIGSQSDVPFVVAAQTLRLFVVILTGPAIARFICRYA
jgi:uncharacterized protein